MKRLASALSFRHLISRSPLWQERPRVAIVTGNTILLKPADAAPVVAAKFVEVMEEAGLPNGVLNYIPGDGAEIGDFLVEHPKTRFVSFTGSRAVGRRIYERAAKVRPGQKWLKRVIAEMGGKDTVLVDKDADLDLVSFFYRLLRIRVLRAKMFSGLPCSDSSGCL